MKAFFDEVLKWVMPGYAPPAEDKQQAKAARKAGKRWGKPRRKKGRTPPML